MPLTTSKLPRKQRRARYFAPDHTNRRMISGHMGNDLLLKYNRRSMPLVTGDVVKVLRGAHKGHTGKIAEIVARTRRLVIEGVTILKADGTKVPLGIDPSNVVISKLNLADPRRREKLIAGMKGSEAEKRAAAAELEAAGKEDAKAAEAERKREAEEREKARIEREAAEGEEEHGHEHEQEEEPKTGKKEES